MKFSHTIAAIEEYEAFQWELADAILADRGPPLKTLAACSRLIKSDFAKLVALYADMDTPRRWAEYWQAAAAFPNKVRRPKQISTAIKAGDPLTYWVANECVRRGATRRLDAQTYKIARKVIAAYDTRELERLQKLNKGDSSDGKDND
jgi:hypothetical protein